MQLQETNITQNSDQYTEIHQAIQESENENRRMLQQSETLSNRLLAIANEEMTDDMVDVVNQAMQMLQDQKKMINKLDKAIADSRDLTHVTDGEKTNPNNEQIQGESKEEER